MLYTSTISEIGWENSLLSISFSCIVLMLTISLGKWCVYSNCRIIDGEGFISLIVKTLVVGYHWSRLHVP